MTIEQALLNALSNLSGFRPEKAKRLFVVYETDIEQMAKDIQASLAGEPKSEEVASDLPPSLAAKPNIPWGDQTLAQLYAERDYWVSKTEGAWGASVGSALEFQKGCNAWIGRRERELSTEIDNRGCA